MRSYMTTQIFFEIFFWGGPKRDADRDGAGKRKTVGTRRKSESRPGMSGFPDVTGRVETCAGSDRRGPVQNRTGTQGFGDPYTIHCTTGPEPFAGAGGAAGKGSAKLRTISYKMRMACAVLFLRAPCYAIRTRSRHRLRALRGSRSRNAGRICRSCQPAASP
jgi:hypothetical protein